MFASAASSANVLAVLACSTSPTSVQPQGGLEHPFTRGLPTGCSSARRKSNFTCRCLFEGAEQATLTLTLTPTPTPTLTLTLILSLTLI